MAKLHLLIEQAFPILLITVPIICLLLLIRLRKLSSYWDAFIMQPWREAMAKENWELSEIYNKHATDFYNDLEKLLWQPWRKLPK